jgi:hypothetical protein
VVKPEDAKGVAATSTVALAVLKDPEDLLEPDSASWDEAFVSDE